MPESYVNIDRDRCTLRRDYDAFELTVKPGDMLTVEYEESGWVFARTEDNHAGWVPRENIEKIL